MCSVSIGGPLSFGNPGRSNMDPMNTVKVSAWPLKVSISDTWETIVTRQQEVSKEDLYGRISRYTSRKRCRFSKIVNKFRNYSDVLRLVRDLSDWVDRYFKIYSMCLCAV